LVLRIRRKKREKVTEAVRKYKNNMTKGHKKRTQKKGGSYVRRRNDCHKEITIKIIT
jgi:hypothetical protein